MMTCVWCGKTGRKKRYGHVTWDELDSTWYRCGSCGSLMILPRPSKKLLQKVYEDDYLNKRLQPHTGVDSRIRYSKTYRPTVYAEYILTLSDLGVTAKKVHSVLDFGCADGVFLEFAKTYFAPTTKLVGADISVNMLAQAKQNGWDVFLVSELASRNQKFDLITLWDVIEHLTDPGTVFAQLKNCLNPGGVIVIQTPRVGELSELFGEHWPHLLPVQHVSLATKKGMEKFATRMGLSIQSHKSFGANAPAVAVPQPYKQAYDTLAKQLDFGDVQILSLKRKIHV